MKWFTIRWEDTMEGCIVEHYPTKAMAERRDKEVQETSNYSQTYSIQEYVVRNKRELLDWLNNNFTHDNG